MTDDSSRPRRAFGSDDSADLGSGPEGLGDNPFARPDGDNPTPTPRRGRRFADPEPEDGVEPDTDPDTAEEPQTEPVPEAMIPAPVLPGRGEGVYDGPGPKPRRSALSSVTPPEPEPKPDAPTDAASEPAWQAEELPPAEKPRQTHWLKAHAKSLVVAGLSVALLAVGAGFGGYYSHRIPAGDESPSPSPSPSESSSAPAIPRVTQADLLTEADAKAINANATWAITATTTTVDEHQFRPACLSTEPADVERLDSFQRAIGSTESNALAALHQVDAFPTEEAAQQVTAERWARMSKCDEVPTRIVSSDTVTGFGDEAYQITVVQEDEEPRFHTLLMVREGNIVSMVDAFSDGSAVPTQAVVDASKRSTTELCSRTGCAVGEVKVQAGEIPPVDPRGWLIPSDLPRMRAGEGRWNAQNPATLTSAGTGCEDMTLASVPKATDRKQNTYLVTQDAEVPSNFGLDEMIFTFPGDGEASEFAKTLGEKINKCGDRLLGTEVKSADIGVEGVQSFDVQRETAEDKIQFQVVITQEGPRVSYLLGTVTKDYRFSNEQLKMVTERADVRLRQFE